MVEVESATVLAEDLRPDAPATQMGVDRERPEVGVGLVRIESSPLPCPLTHTEERAGSKWKQRREHRERLGAGGLT